MSYKRSFFSVQPAHRLLHYSVENLKQDEFDGISPGVGRSGAAYHRHQHLLCSAGSGTGALVRLLEDIQEAHARTAGEDPRTAWTASDRKRIGNGRTELAP